MKRKAPVFLLGMVCVAIMNFAQPTQSGFIYSAPGASPQNYSQGPWHYIIQGDNHLQHRDYESAVLAFDLAISNAPHLAEAYLKRSTAKRMLGRNQEAAFDLQMAYRHNPYAADLYGVADSRNRLRVMALDLQALLLESPEDYLADYFQRLIDSLAAGHLIAAHGRQQVLPENSADTPKDHLLQLVLDNWKRGDRGAALRYIQQCLERYPQSTPARTIAGWLFLETDQINSASIALEIAREQNPTFAIIDYLLGRLAEREGRLSEALDYYGLAERDSQLFVAGMAKAALYLRTENGEQAIATYTRLLNHRHGEASLIRWNRALAYAFIGEPILALEDLNADDRPESATEHLLRGNLLLLLNQYPGAIEHYSRALNLDPELVSAYYNRALARILAHDRTEACLDLRQSERLGLSRSTEKITFFCNF